MQRLFFSRRSLSSAFFDLLLCLPLLAARARERERERRNRGRSGGRECAVSIVFLFFFSFLVSFQKIKKRKKRKEFFLACSPPSFSIPSPSPKATNLILFVGPFSPLFQRRIGGDREREAEERQERGKTEKEKTDFFCCCRVSPFTHESLFLSFLVARERASAAPRASLSTPSSVQAFKRSSVGVVEPCSVVAFFDFFFLSFSLFLSIKN